jgi:hypothetical protein
MRLGIAEVHEEPVTEQLSDMPIVALDNFGTDPLICPHHITPVFRVELAGQLGGVHEVAEHHGELPSFRVGRRWCSRERCDLRGGLFLGGRRLCWLSTLRDQGGWFRSVPSPHEHSAIFICGELLCLNDLCLEGFEIFII